MNNKGGYLTKKVSAIEVDPERLPSALMQLAEYYMGCKSSIRKSGAEADECVYTEKVISQLRISGYHEFKA